MSVAAVLSLGAGACTSASKDKVEPQAAGDKAPEMRAGDKAPATRAGDSSQAAADPIKAAIEAPGRPEDERSRDPERKPHETLTFFGVRPGMKVADLMTGTGYYADLLSRVVGPQGHVYAQNNDFIVKRFDLTKLESRLKLPEFAHVTHLVAELDDLKLPAGELDVVLMSLFYHDTYWLGTDRPTMNKAIFDALKPGGVYAIIDHHAEAGSGERDTKSLHRGDAEMIKQEIIAAGFVFDGESDVLRHPEDARKVSVFDKDMRGKTDRFVYRFRKPAN